MEIFNKMLNCRIEQIIDELIDCQISVGEEYDEIMVYPDERERTEG